MKVTNDLVLRVSFIYFIFVIMYQTTYILYMESQGYVLGPGPLTLYMLPVWIWETASLHLRSGLKLFFLDKVYS